MKYKPMTLMLKAKTKQDLDKIAEVEKALARQLGWNIKLTTMVTDDKEDYLAVSFPADREAQAAVDMLTRRSNKHTEPALLTKEHIHKDKFLGEVINDKKLKVK